MIRAGRMVGEQISNYRVIGPAVPWPLADVHTGQDPRTGQVVDIILLPPDAAASAGVADQFLTEMRAVLAFHHQGFVRLLDCARLNDGAIYLTTNSANKFSFHVLRWYHHHITSRSAHHFA